MTLRRRPHSGSRRVTGSMPMRPKIWKKSYLGIPSPYAEEMASQCDAVINGVGH